MKALIPAIWESSLRKRLRENDREAFEAVVRSHYATVYRQLYFLTNHDESQVEDLTQETFVAAWQSLPSFDGRSAIGTWLHTVAVRVWYRAVREGKRQSVQVPLAAALADCLADNHAADPARTATDGLAQARLSAAVKALPPAYRRAVEQFYYEEKRYQEIADSEQVPIGTVKSRLSMAMKQLRERLDYRKEELL